MKYSDNMNKIFSIVSFVTVLAAVGCQSAAADRYTITGTIPGVADGTRVILRNNELRDMRANVDTAYTEAGKFLLEGSVAAPALATIIIDNPGGGTGKAINLVLENAGIEIYAPAIDSIPPSWYAGHEGKLLEKCVKIKGGKAQAEYQEYCDKMFPYDLEARKAHYNLYWSEDSKSRSPEQVALLKSAYSRAETGLNAAKDRFVENHSDYNISIKFLTESLDSPFSFTDEQLDGLLASTRNTVWTARRDTLAKAVERYRDMVAMSPYTDIRLLDQKGDTVMLADYVGKGNYVFIDFWASWCGPCRAAIPHVKELNAMYPEGLTILSVSVDREKEAWEKAMREEEMTWTQLWAPDDIGSEAAKAYRFRAIPALVVITPDGLIALETNNPNVISAYLETKFTKNSSNQ